MLVELLSDALLAWYDKNARLLPWRHRASDPPPDPYRVWLSEVMLQQTTVAAVIPYYLEFTRRWPTIEALAATSDAELMSAWAGLGYYARARHLLACARVIVRDHGGRFPDNEATLLKLPGIGPYTAAAITAIAFNRPAVVVDGNVERVMSRLFAVEMPLPQARSILRAHAAMLTPQVRPGDYAQAVMDLGATLCTPKSPACGQCPWSDLCAAYKTRQQTRYPLKSPKRVRPTRHGIVFWLEAEGYVLLVRRPDKGLLSGMLGLPTSKWTDEAAPSDGAPLDIEWRLLPTPVRHGFTHFDLVLTIAKADLPTRPDIEGIWMPVDKVSEAGLPTLFRRAAKAALALPLL